MLCAMESGQTKENIILMSYILVQSKMYIIKVIKYFITFLDQCKIHNKLGWTLPLVPRLIK